MALFDKKKKANTSDTEMLKMILQNQGRIAQRLEAIEKRLEKFEKKHERSFFNVIQGLYILYGKAVMARLNFLELSEGRPVTVSDNERKEIDNSFSENPNTKMLVLPIPNKAQREADAKKRKSRLN